MTYALSARRSDASPKRITRSKHSSFIERTNRSANALQFGARTGQRTGFTPCARQIDNYYL